MARADVQIFHVLKAVPQIAKEGMVQMFQHPPLPNDVAYALRSDHFILPYVFQRKGQPGVLSLDNPNLPERAFTDDP